MQKIQRYGWKRDALDCRDKVLTITKRVPLPLLVDLRGANMPPIYDQGELGSCTANAIARAVDFERSKQGLPFMTPSRLFIYYCERAMEGTIASDAGAEIRDGIKVVAGQGVCAESEWPYDISKFSDSPTPQCFTDAVPHEALQYSSVTQTHDLYFPRHCMGVLGRPVVIGISVFDSFESEEVSASGMVPMPAGNAEPIGGHAICLVGYDDAKRLLTFANSWGAEWGDKGFGYLPYDYVNNASLANDFWTILLDKG